jgi:hypothetical protein
MESFHHSSENHRINFSVQGVAPTAIAFGKPYIVEVKVVSPDDEESWTSAPELQLKDYTLILKDRTHFRTPYHTDTVFIESDVPLNNGALNTPLVVNEPVKVQGMFPTTIGHRSFPPPSFTSVAVKRVYAMKIEGTILCLGEESKFNIYWNDVVVYPARMKDDLETMRAIEDGTEVLPQYQS